MLADSITALYAVPDDVASAALNVFIICVYIIYHPLTPYIIQ